MRDDALITSGTLARLANVSQQTIANWRKRGILEPVPWGAYYKYEVGKSLDAIARWHAEGKDHVKRVDTSDER